MTGFLGVPVRFVHGAKVRLVFLRFPFQLLKRVPCTKLQVPRLQVLSFPAWTSRWPVEMEQIG